jgi:hypothetical protein
LTYKEALRLKAKNFSLILILILALGVFPGCSDDDDDASLGPGEGTIQVGDLVISVGSGSRPQISWTGGSVWGLVVLKEAGENEVEGIWAIMSSSDGDTISSPVTQGTVPGGAIDATSVYGLQYEDLQAGQAYAIVVTKAALKGLDWANLDLSEDILGSPEALSSAGAIIFRAE